MIIFLFFKVLDMIIITYCVHISINFIMYIYVTAHDKQFSKYY